MSSITLFPKWKPIFSKPYFQEDFFAALTVALIAVPLSLAIALASGVDPSVGLVTAIIAGIVCALFGGNPLAVSGPAAAMAVIVGLSIEQHGVFGLVWMVLICGALQILTGFLRLGRYVRLMPISVIEGFTAGIGAIIFIGQLPRALGLPAPSESHVVDVILHVGGLLHQSHLNTVLVSVSVILMLWLLPKLSPRIPAPLLAVALPTLFVSYFHFPDGLAIIGTLPNTLPWPSLPQIPANIDWISLFGTGVLIYALASLETLLSSTAIDKLAKGQPSNLDQELIGQGLGNVAVAFFGGIPVTGVIARSAANVMAGAKTNRASIIHSILLVAIVFFFAPFISKIPVAALAGILLFIALKMMSPKKLMDFWRVSRSDALIYSITFLVIVFVDLLEGIQWGLVASLGILALQLGRTSFKLHEDSGNTSYPYRFELRGTMTFLSSLKIDQLRSQISFLDPKRGLIIDMSAITDLDSSGADMLLDLISDLREKKFKVAIFGLHRTKTQFLLSISSHKNIEPTLAYTEQDLLRIFDEDIPPRSHLRLEKGLKKFLENKRHDYQELFDKLSYGQFPHTLFITCSDSRIQPNLITSTDPGELFIVRNVGNMIPQFSKNAAFAEGAAIDFAVGILGVREIVVCGHSGCGAMSVLHAKEPLPENLSSLNNWRKATVANEVYQEMPQEMGIDQVGHIHVLHQLDNLRTYPLIQEYEKAGRIQLHAWFWEIKNGDVEIWSPTEKRYINLGKLGCVEP